MRTLIPKSTIQKVGNSVRQATTIAVAYTAAASVTQGLKKSSKAILQTAVSSAKNVYNGAKKATGSSTKPTYNARTIHSVQTSIQKGISSGLSKLKLKGKRP